MKPIDILKEVLKNYTPEQLEEALKGKGTPTGITVGEYISAMKDFEINRYEISGESFVVCTGVSGVNPFSLLSEVRKEYFKKYSKPTMLFFDLYTTNGDKDNRFAKMFLGDEGFVSETFSIVKAEELPIKLLEIQNARIEK